MSNFENNKEEYVDKISKGEDQIVIVKNEKKQNHIVKLAIEGLLLVTFVLYFALGWNVRMENINFYLNKVVISVFVIVSAMFIQAIIDLATKVKFKNQRAKTVTTLVRSLAKYAIGIVACLMILMNFLGTEYMTELLTGMGILGLVIGLGCQTLINDVVAGIFMVFEGNYQVGDVVVLNGWRGVVVEIGLRTTVIEDVGGNKKIINNSSISEIVNNSKEHSIATCTLGIEYDENLERVEKIIENHIGVIKEKYPQIITGPTYKGVQELGASSINLFLVCTCKEEDKYQIQRDLNREFKLLFDKNNINFPYPQTTISARKESINININKD